MPMSCQCALPTDTLQGRAARRGIMYGGAVSSHHLQTVRVRRLYFMR